MDTTRKRRAGMLAAAVLAIAAVIALGLAMPAHAEAQSWSRFGAGEKDNYRYGTNALVAQDGWQSADTIIIAKGSDYPDALAVSALAGLYDTPVLLSETKTLTTQTVQQIDRLTPTKAYVLGDENSISTNVVKSLEKKGITVKRLAGTEKTGYRVGTALEIYEAGKGKWGSTAIVVAGDSFADALSISPLAYAEGYPIFLTQSSDHALNKATVSAIKNGGFTRVLLAGGTDRVSDKVPSQLSGIECKRLAGTDRYRTSALIADYEVANSSKIAYDNLIVTTGSKPFDALGGGALAGKRGTVLLLADDSSAGAYCVDSVVGKNASAIGFGTFLGDTNSISAKLAQRFENAAASEPPVSPASDFEYITLDGSEGYTMGEEYVISNGHGGGGWTLTYYGPGAYISGYAGSSPNVVIPATIEGKPVLYALFYGGQIGTEPQTIDLRQSTNLKGLVTSTRNSINANGCSELLQLACEFGGNSLKSLDVRGCTSLTFLSCNNNSLTSLDLSQCPSLETLSCSNGNLTSLDISRCVALKTLRCENNRITDTTALKAWLAQEGHGGQVDPQNA